MVKLGLVYIFVCFTLSVGAQISPKEFTLEYRTNPEGVDVQKPRFFWKLETDKAEQH